MDSGGDLVSRDTSSAVHHELWLEWHSCGGLSPEQRLSRLTAWALAADKTHASYGLRLPGVEVLRAQGLAQRRACLEALALWH